MQNYIYKLKDDRGKILYGFVEANDVKELKKKLRQSKFYFISASPCDQRKIFDKKVDLEALLMFTNRLSSLIEAGIPILTAMYILWRQTEDKTLQLVVSHIRRNLEEGRKISEALDDFPKIFPPMYRALIGVAEKAGGLVYILKKLSEYLQYQKEIIVRTKKATLYPTIVVIFAFLVLIAMFTFVVPTFQQVLVKLNAQLPLLTQIVLSISKVLRSWVFIVSMIVLAVLLITLHKYLLRREKYVSALDYYQLKIPFFGHLFFINYLSRFVRSLSILLGAGLPIVECFQVAKTTIGNHEIVKNVDVVKKRLEQGTSLYEAFQDARIFPILLVEMIGVGESSGTFVKVLENLAKHFDEEVDYNVNKILTMLEPFLIIFVGLIVIITLLAVYLPIFSIWQNLTR